MSIDGLKTVHISMGILFAVVGGWVCLVNWVMFVKTLTKKRFHSVVPFGGALLLVLGLRGFESTRPYAFLAIIADYGTLAFIGSIPHLVRRWWQQRRS